jgi:hypothetical protein
VALFLRFITFFLISTLIAVVIATLAECQPFNHYWQVIPDPGPTCRTGYVNLITMGTCDVITDLLLIAFPVPIIMLAQMPLKRKLALVILFCLSLLLVAITCYRVPSVIQHRGSQQYRSLLASLEILAATAVSNALVIGSFVRDRGVKKLKYKRDQGSASVSESMDKSFVRRNTVMQNQWGSDSDLATGLCIRLDSDMCISPTTTADGTPLPRPAPPVTLPPHMPLSVARTGSIDPSWSFTTSRRSDDDHASVTDSVDIKISPREYLRTNTSPRESAAVAPRRVSFSDVGGLLTRALPDDPHVRSLVSMSNTTSNLNTVASSPAPAEASQWRSGSRAFLEDLGIVAPHSSSRLHGHARSGIGRSQTLPQPQPQSRPQTHVLPVCRSSSDITLDGDVELQDVGGLLSRQHPSQSPSQNQDRDRDNF